MPLVESAATAHRWTGPSKKTCALSNRLANQGELYHFHAERAIADSGAGDKLVRRYRALGDGLHSAAREVKSCGLDHFYYACVNGHSVCRPRHCGRVVLCQECARVQSERRRKVYGDRVKAVLSEVPLNTRPKMLTLTLRPHETETYGDLFTRLRVSTARLLRVLWLTPHGAHDWAVYFDLFPTQGRSARAKRRKFVERQRAHDKAGAIASYEFGPKRANAHVHVLLVGSYRDQALVSEAWERITGDSRVVDIRAIAGMAGGLREVFKYVTKFSAHSVETLAELYVGTLSVCVPDEPERRATVRSHRRVECYGSLRGACALEHELEQPEPVVCGICGCDMGIKGLVPWQLYNQGIRAPPDPRYPFGAIA